MLGVVSTVVVILCRVRGMLMSRVGQETMPMVCSAQAVGRGAMHPKGVGVAPLVEGARCVGTWVWGDPWLQWVPA